MYTIADLYLPEVRSYGCVVIRRTNLEPPTLLCLSHHTFKPEHISVQQLDSQHTALKGKKDLAVMLPNTNLNAFDHLTRGLPNHRQPLKPRT